MVKHDGTVVIEFQWKDMELSKLKEDLLPVAIEKEDKKKWGFVNIKTGKTQIEPAYDAVEYFEQGFAPVCDEKVWGTIDTYTLTKEVDGKRIKTVKQFRMLNYKE